MRIPHRRRAGFTLIEITVVVLIIAVIAMLLLPNYVRARSRSRLTACETNLRNMASALEVYAADNDKKFPTDLTALTPACIQSVPTCPSAGSSQPYVSGFSSTVIPANYTLTCQGSYHFDLGLPADAPSFQYGSGLREY